MVREIALGRGYAALVDDEDFERLSAFQWNPFIFRNGKCYASRAVPRVDREPGTPRTVYLHRVIMGAKAGQIVDHVDRNSLDCRRANLRFADGSQNAANAVKPRRRPGFRGVQLNHKTGKYVARVRWHNEYTRLGYFVTAEEAARAYDKKARELQGDFAVLNFPEAVAA